jgi:hypothetical protein
LPGLYTLAKNVSICFKSAHMEKLISVELVTILTSLVASTVQVISDLPETHEFAALL